MFILMSHEQREAVGVVVSYASCALHMHPPFSATMNAVTARCYVYILFFLQMENIRRVFMKKTYRFSCLLSILIFEVAFIQLNTFHL